MHILALVVTSEWDPCVNGDSGGSGCNSCLLHVLLCYTLIQAMAAYRTAARLFPGLHLPLTGMGMEYQRMNNLHLAEQMFLQVRQD